VSDDGKGVNVDLYSAVVNTPLRRSGMSQGISSFIRTPCVHPLTE